MGNLISRKYDFSNAIQKLGKECYDLCFDPFETETMQQQLFKAIKEGDVKAVQDYVNTKEMLNFTLGDTDITKGKGYSPLGYAIKLGRVDIAKTLLEGGASVKWQADDRGVFPLEFAVSKGNKKMINLLISAMKKIDFNNTDVFGNPIRQKREITRSMTI